MKYKGTRKKLRINVMPLITDTCKLFYCEIV